MRAIASFTLDTFDEVSPENADTPPRHQRLRIAKSFRGEIEGHGSVEMLASRNDDGAGYVAIEHISGVVHARSGGFMLLHIGTMAGAETWARWPIVPGSGSDDLSTIRGEGRIEIDADGRHTFTLDYELE